MNPKVILIVAEEHDPLADTGVIRLREMGHQPVRISAGLPAIGKHFTLSTASSPSILATRNQAVGLQDIHAVWWRVHFTRAATGGETAPTCHDLLSETEFESAWGMMLCRWCNSLIALASSYSYVARLGCASRVGLAVPRTLLPHSPQAALAFLEELGGKCCLVMAADAAMDMAPGRADLTRPIVTTRMIEESLDSFCLIPICLQEVVERNEIFHVVVIGVNVYCMTAKHRRRKGADDCSVSYSKSEPTAEMSRLCRDFCARFGLSVAHIQLVDPVGGQPLFLECDTCPDWAWFEEVTPNLKIFDRFLEFLLEEKGT